MKRFRSSARQGPRHTALPLLLGVLLTGCGSGQEEVSGTVRYKGKPLPFGTIQFLGSDGVLNTLLQYVHLTSHPLDFLLYSPFAVVLTLTHIYTPFTILPIYASLEHIPRPLVEASHDLGASRFTTFLRVILPLSMPGLLAGATFAFVLSLGDFLAPLLVGGPSGTMIANIVQSLFGAAYDWPLGASISVCILLITITLLFLTERLEKRWSFK